MENSSLAQVLSQRLTNMEQQLFLLKDDLKNAVGTLKEKEREILTLQNRIALAERRRELEEAGQPVDESLKDVVMDVGSKSNSKREVLENEVVALARKLEEMERFFGDYGLAWVKEDALDEKDLNNLWIRKSNIHYTPDFEKVFLVVEELNLGNAEPQIVRKGNTAQFKTAQLLNLTLYADGIQLENNPFRKYDSPSVEEFFRDLEDGYFPTELKGSHPEGVIFKVKDRRTMRFADDPDKRPVVSPDAKSGIKGVQSASSPTSLSSLRAAARRSTTPRGSSTSQTYRNDKPSASFSRKGSLSKRRSSLKKTPSRPSRSSAEGKPLSPSVEPKRGSDPTSAVPPNSTDEDSAGRKQPDAADTGEVDKPSIPSEGKPSGDAAYQVLPIDDGKQAGEVPGGGSPGGVASGDTTPVTVVPPVLSDQAKPNPEQDLKELFRGKTPGTSAQRLPPQAVEPTQEVPKDAYGLPKPPFPSPSNTTADVRALPLGPPSKQFDNFLFPKTTETQTSLTLVPGMQTAAAPPVAPCPQPTHVTNITYNEAPITVQMTPSEFMPTRPGTGAAHPPDVQGGNLCPTHHPRPCNCVPVPCDTCPEERKDGAIGSVGLAKFPAETEYRERFTESAINNKNVLEFKKKSQEARGSQPEGRSPSPAPVPRQPAATLLVRPDQAPIPPDPVQPHNLIDPNVKWEHFTYLGRPKGQEPVHTPDVTQERRPKRRPSPQVVQLNEKTSDRMISVRLRTKSGDKEYTAHVFPEEPMEKLWSLLKMNARDYTLSSDKTPHVPLKRGSIGKISKGEDLTLVISENKGSEIHIKPRGSVNSRAASVKSTDDKATKTRKEISSVSKDGSRVTNVNISISIDSHSSYGGRSKSDSLHPDKKEPRLRKLSSKGTLGGHSSSKSSANPPTHDSRKLTTKSQPSRESAGSHSAGSSPLSEMTEKAELDARKKPMSFQSAFPPEITPKSRSKSLSKHLSVSSLHKMSFKGSAPKLEVILETESRHPSEPLSSKLSVPAKPLDGISSGSTKEATTPAKNSSFSSEPKSSNSSANGIAAFVVPTESPRDGQPTMQPKDDLIEPVGETDSSKPPAAFTTEVSRESDSVKRRETSNVKQDGALEVTAIAAEPSSLRSLAPLTQPPVAGQLQQTNDLETLLKSQSGKSTGPSPVEGLQVEDDVHGDMKTLVSSVIMGIGSKSAGASADPVKHVASSDSVKRDSRDRPIVPRKKSSEDKSTLSRKDWHPDEEPPSIRYSDVDIARNEPPAVEPKTNPKKSYDTNDSEQIFERYQHPETPMVTGEQESARGLEAQKDDPTKENDKPNKGEKQGSKKMKNKSINSKPTVKPNAAEGDVAEADDDAKSGSAESVKSYNEIEENRATEDLKDESITAV